MNNIWIPKLSSTIKINLSYLDDQSKELLFHQARYATVIQVMLQFEGSSDDFLKYEL